jgi:uncharacterized membrane protein YgcG
LKIEEDPGRNWWEKIEGRHYLLRRLKDYTNDTSLEDYERQYLDILLGQAEIFSTRQVKRLSDAEKMRLGQAIRDLREDMVKETEIDTNAYETKPSREYWAYIIGAIIFFIFFGLTIVSFNLPNAPVKQKFIAVMAGVLCGLIAWLFYRFEARLSKEGRILKEDWLGFKMFLETAERYRLQNLTPETFERFLPYAIIFGIEKKWGAVFNNVFMPQPTWYAGAAGLSPLPSQGAGGFSAAAFSASFSSSFSSAFSSSGGGGSAGGGGAGGGGGGGGGAG